MKILIDGSNVLYWRGGIADRQAPGIIARALIARRFAPFVYLDHSIHRHTQTEDLAELARSTEVIIAPSGTPADVLLLDACASGRYQIVSADRFEVWRSEYPRMRRDWLVTGRIGKGGHVSFSKKLRSAPL
jgi:hypothetical protein